MVRRNKRIDDKSKDKYKKIKFCLLSTLGNDLFDLVDLNQLMRCSYVVINLKTLGALVQTSFSSILSAVAPHIFQTGWLGLVTAITTPSPARAAAPIWVIIKLFISSHCRSSNRDRWHAFISRPG